MRVSELKVGELYKIRSDRKTHVIVQRGMLEIRAKRSVIYSRGVQMSATDTGWGCPSKHCKHENGSARGVSTAKSAAVHA